MSLTYRRDACSNRGVSDIQVGAGGDAGVDVGPVISKASLERIRSILGDAEKAGAVFELDGRGVAVAGFPQVCVCVCVWSRRFCLSSIFYPYLYMHIQISLSDTGQLRGAYDSVRGYSGHDVLRGGDFRAGSVLYVCGVAG